MKRWRTSWFELACSSAAIVEILRCADESGERAVVEGVREGVVGVEVENLVESSIQLQSEAVVIGIAGVVSVIKQAGIVVCGRAAGFSPSVRKTPFRLASLQEAASAAGNSGCRE